MLKHQHSVDQLEKEKPDLGLEELIDFTVRQGLLGRQAGETHLVHLGAGDTSDELLGERVCMVWR